MKMYCSSCGVERYESLEAAWSACPCGGTSTQSWPVDVPSQLVAEAEAFGMGLSFDVSVPEPERRHLSVVRPEPVMTTRNVNLKVGDSVTIEDVSGNRVVVRAVDDDPGAA